MRIGLFLHKVDPLYRINDLISEFGSEIVGYSSPMLLSELPKNIDFQPHPMELLVCCDIALIFSTNDFFWEIPRSALRRGVNVFFADLTAYDINSLNEFKQMAHEIGARIGFGFSGQSTSELQSLNEGSSSYYMAVNRSLITGCNFTSFRKTIIYDLATIVRFKNSAVKKIRSLALPLSQCEYNLLHTSVETTNGSIFSYTANRISQIDSFEIVLYGNGNENLVSSQSSWSPVSNDTPDFTHLYSPNSFIESVRNDTAIEFSIDHAIETFRLYDDVTQRHSRFT